MIFSNSLSDTNLSPFASLFKQTVDQLRELKDEANGTIDTILRKIIQANKIVFGQIKIVFRKHRQTRKFPKFNIKEFRSFLFGIEFENTNIFALLC